MNDYYAVRVDMTPAGTDIAEITDITDLAAAFLADAGFESFEPDASGLTTYIRASEADPCAIAREALADFPMDVKFEISSSFVEGKDWNEEWERHYFKPIIIGGECAIHSSFHTDVPEARYDIVIDPKMAFGTGHHDTTSQMAQYILELDMEGKSVTDVGTGTGILAMLASKKGASAVTGIEIDRPAYDNAVDNAAINHTPINLIHGDASDLEGLEPADYLFANINRNIILEDIDRYASALKSGGTMLLSGFYNLDIPMVEEAAKRQGLRLVDYKESNNWVAVRFQKE